MSPRLRATASFPATSIPSLSGGLPIEVALIAQLGHGAGSQLVATAVARQQSHAQFVDELDEPSAKIAGSHFEQGDATSLYTFAVGAKGHPFHRHAGHRVFTAISGSAGAQLRFSTATSADIGADPMNFLRALRYIEIPPDSLFTVRFGGGTWHQFAPLPNRAKHPAFFALSCHTNELGGDLPESLRQQVLAGAASIPALTDVLPQPVIELLESMSPERMHIPTVALALERGHIRRLLCGVARCALGTARSLWANFTRVGGFLIGTGDTQALIELRDVPADSLLQEQLADNFHHEDAFCLTVAANQSQNARASVLLADVLEGFMAHAPVGVSRMMKLRNVLVRPFGLRTSPLGCPVSSLLGKPDRQVFAGRFPVFEQKIDDSDSYAQVILGANDKHLLFRSCVSVRVNNGSVDVMLGTRVYCKNLFGHLYFGLIDRVHRRYVSPAMMRKAVDYAFPARPGVTKPGLASNVLTIAPHGVNR